MSLAAPGEGPLAETTGQLARAARDLDIVRQRLTRHPMFLVVGIATMWGLALTLPLALHLDSELYGRPGDATGTIAVYWWWSYALTHGKSLFDFPWGAPLGSGFELVPFSALQIAISAPLSVLVGPTVAYNLEVLSGFPLSAAVTFLLARRLRFPALAAAFTSLAFTFMPYHLEKAMGHLGMVHLELFSGTLLFLLRWRESGKWANLVGAGALGGLALCTDPYDAYIIAVMVAVFFLVSTAVPSERLRHALSRLAGNFLGAMFVALVSGLFVPVALLAAHRPGTSSNYRQGVAASANLVSRTSEGVSIYSARLQEYVLPWHANPLTPEAVRRYEETHLHLSNFTENTLFLGYVVIVLAVVGAVVTRRAFPVALALAIAGAGLLFAETPTPHRVAGVTLASPSYYLFQLLPYFRAYARFAILVMLAASLLGGLGLAVLMGWLRAGWRRAFLLLPFLLLAVEFNNIPPTHTTRLYPAPAAYTWLLSQPPGILVEYPLHAGKPATEEIQTRQYILYQQVHHHPIFNGSQPDSRAGLMEPELEPYYASQTVSRLRALGIRYVFVHVADYAAAGLETPVAVPGLRYVSSMDGIDVFEVLSG